METAILIIVSAVIGLYITFAHFRMTRTAGNTIPVVQGFFTDGNTPKAVRVAEEAVVIFIAHRKREDAVEMLKCLCVLYEVEKREEDLKLCLLAAKLLDTTAHPTSAQWDVIRSRFNTPLKNSALLYGAGA